MKINDLSLVLYNDGKLQITYFFLFKIRFFYKRKAKCSGRFFHIQVLVR